MAKPTTICSSVLSLVILVSNALAQDQAGTPVRRSGITITASATSQQVRFAAPSSIVQIRLEVYTSTGRKLFDNELRGGNVLDWRLHDGQAESLPDGAYLCVVTVKGLSGKLTQRIGSVIIEKNAASLQAVDAGQMTTQQAEAIGPLEENAALTLIKEDGHPTTTVIAHNGEEGQITRGRGALTFRMGDFFSGKDTEQMRLTPEGNLGIGITNPAVRLDVIGLIRASQGIVFPDGSIQYSASRKTFGAESLRPDQSPKKGVRGGFETAAIEVSGTGTTGRIPKWLDGPSGVLNDSNMIETSGAIGINGAPNTNFRLDVNGSVLFRGSNPGFNLVGLRPSGNQWVFQTVDDDGRFRLFSQDNINPGVERLTIGLSSGNVGIGETNPTARLAVSTPSATSGNNTAYFLAPNIGPHASNIHFGTTGDWYIRSAAVAGKVILQDTGGKVGIGTNSPTTAKLHVFDDSVGAAVYANSTVSGGGFTIGGIGVLGETQAADGVGVYGRNLFGGFAMFADGNTSQLRNKGGWVKALLKVSAAGGIERCYNGITGSAGGTCGLSVDPVDTGLFDINFGFRVDDRFVSVTTDAAGEFSPSGFIIYGFGNQNTIRVVTRVGSFLANNSFTIIVY